MYKTLHKIRTYPTYTIKIHRKTKIQVSYKTIRNHHDQERFLS